MDCLNEKLAVLGAEELKLGSAELAVLVQVVEVEERELAVAFIGVLNEAEHLAELFEVQATVAVQVEAREHVKGDF